MKATYLYLSLALISLALLTSCGPDANKPTPEVTSITLQKNTATLYTGDKLELIATVSPADVKVTFSSSNTAVATVCEKGVVKAIAPGTATITAQAGDKKATCTVTVVATKTKNVTLLNKLDSKKYPSGSTIDYVATISQEDVRMYGLELFFSVLKTTKYTVSLKFDQPISGSICLGENCRPVTDQSDFENTIDLLADGEESVYPQKEKDQPTSRGAHIDITTPAGETYKNRLAIQLKPADGGETLSWTVNLAVTVK